MRLRLSPAIIVIRFRVSSRTRRIQTAHTNPTQHQHKQHIYHPTMASAAAVTTGRRRRLRQEAIQEERRKTSERSREVFDKLSHDGEYLSESQVPDFLAQTLMIRDKNRLDPHAVQLVIDMAREKKQMELNNDEAATTATMTTSTTTKPGSTVMLAKGRLLKAAQKYGSYARQAKKIDQIFAEFDKNKDGMLSRDELKRALKAHEQNANRSVNGIVTYLVIDDNDIDFILQNCDVEGDGYISRNELLPVIATWEQMALYEIEQRENATCCMIL